jgi:5'(3')-deoxyribonucleotidase
MIGPGTLPGRSAGRQPAPLAALIDMDGTLCDCAGALAKGLALLRGPGEDPLSELSIQPPEYIAERRRLIMRTPGFWRNLRPLPLGFQLIDILRTSGFEPYILTKGPSDHSLAWMEKVDWCRHYVPGIRVIVTEDKRLVRGTVLVEDWPPYIEEWLQAHSNATVIVPAQPWNSNVEELFPDRCVRFDGQDHEMIRRRLANARTAAGE